MKTQWKLLCVVFFSVIIISCKKDQKNVPIQIQLTDNPVPYDSVMIHIKDVKVKLNKDDAGWIDIDSKDTTVNLLDFQNGIHMIIAQDEVPQGILKEVRFILGDGNYVVVNGRHYNLQTPSAEEAGLKIKIDKHLDESLNTFMLDFDAALSVKEESTGYKLMPVIKLK
jgi:hypothetical protein